MEKPSFWQSVVLQVWKSKSLIRKWNVIDWGHFVLSIIIQQTLFRTNIMVLMKRKISLSLLFNENHYFPYSRHQVILFILFFVYNGKVLPEMTDSHCPSSLFCMVFSQQKFTAGLYTDGQKLFWYRRTSILQVNIYQRPYSRLSWYQWEEQMRLGGMILGGVRSGWSNLLFM